MTSDSPGGETEQSASGIRTLCDECQLPLYYDEGVELSHGSYCDLCARDYQPVDSEVGL